MRKNKFILLLVGLCLILFVSIFFVLQKDNHKTSADFNFPKPNLTESDLKANKIIHEADYGGVSASLGEANFDVIEEKSELILIVTPTKNLIDYSQDRTIEEFTKRIVADFEVIKILKDDKKETKEGSVVQIDQPEFYTMATHGGRDIYYSFDTYTPLDQVMLKGHYYIVYLMDKNDFYEGRKCFITSGFSLHTYNIDGYDKFDENLNKEFPKTDEKLKAKEKVLKKYEKEIKEVAKLARKETKEEKKVGTPEASIMEKEISTIESKI